MKPIIIIFFPAILKHNTLVVYETPELKQKYKEINREEEKRVLMNYTHKLIQPLQLHSPSIKWEKPIITVTGSTQDDTLIILRKLHQSNLKMEEADRHLPRGLILTFQLVELK